MTITTLDDLPTRQLDAEARKGRAKLVTDGEAYALARYRPELETWIHAAAGRAVLPLDFQPTHYVP